MFSASCVSTPSPTFGNSIIVIPIEWPVTWPRWKPRSWKPFETAVDVVARRAGAHRGACRLEVLDVRLLHGAGVADSPLGRDGADTSTQCMPGPATSSDGSTKSPRISSLRAILNSGARPPSGRARSDHVHRQPAAALGDEVLLGDGHHLGAVRARRRPPRPRSRAC